MAFNDFSDEVYDAIRDYLTANWSHTPIAWPNETFENAAAEPFVAFEIHGTLFAQMSIGANPHGDNRWDEEGSIWLHVTVPRGSGMLAGRGAARAMAEMFRGTLLLSERLEFMDAVIGPGQAGDEDGNWFVISVNIDWRLMEA